MERCATVVAISRRYEDGVEALPDQAHTASEPLPGSEPRGAAMHRIGLCSSACDRLDRARMAPLDSMISGYATILASGRVHR